jgi:hypothetical protein
MGIGKLGAFTNTCFCTVGQIACFFVARVLAELWCAFECTHGADALGK